MIPTYLQGKNAAQIIGEVGGRFIDDAGFNEKQYILYLEGLLLLAIKDALCNADLGIRVRELIDGFNDGPGDRAVAFLNIVLPYEEKV